MAEVVLFHHLRGLTDGVHAFAGELRAGGIPCTHRTCSTDSARRASTTEPRWSRASGERRSASAPALSNEPVLRLWVLPEPSPAPQGSMRMTSSVRGPCTPCTRSSSMSLVADEPLIQVHGRPGPRWAMACGTIATIWLACRTHRW
jgi:hypothetical protein